MHRFKKKEFPLGLELQTCFFMAIRNLKKLIQKSN